MVDKADISVTLEDLNPVELYGYATYIENRTNGAYAHGKYPFRRHKTLAQAKSAVAQGRRQIVYEFSTNEAGRRVVTGQHAPETHIYRWLPGKKWSEGEWVEIYV